MVRALLTAAGGTVAERADVLPTAAKLGVSNFMNIASRWLCSQVLLWTTVTLRGANDQRSVSPARSHAYWTMRLDRLGGPCPGSASLRSGRCAAKRSRPMHHRSVAFCLPPPSPEIYEL